jgi:tripartite-type tricarboxylate transporter receptor subunit TctC
VAAQSALQSPALREKFLQQGAEPTDPDPAKLEALMRADYARWADLVASARLKVD